MKNARKIGELLKNTRLERGLDIDKIALTLRIRKRYLNCLEEGQFDEIPGNAYIIGYIKMYADYLGILHEIKKLQIETPTQRKKFTVAKKHINDNWIIASLFAALILIVILLIGYRNFDKRKTTIMQHLQDESINYNIR